MKASYFACCLPALMLALLGPQAAAQTPIGTDPKTVLDGARRAQIQFEEQRRSYLLPPEHSGGGRCDVRFGNFCYWYDGDTNPLPEEPDGVVTARQALLDDLAARAGVLPNDEWIAGQRVRYLVESGDIDGATQVAEACRVASWWCDALRGFTYHAAGRASDAEHAFAMAYARHSPAGKCLWEDFSPLIDEVTGSKYLDLDCNARHNVNRRFLWLADPFLGDSVNDLANELRARMVTARFLENSASAYGFAFDFPQRDMILRYGWGVRWTRSDRSVQGHEARPAFTLGPESWWDTPEERAEGPRWSLRDAEQPRLRYAPSWLARLSPLDESQTAMFRRGDTTLVAAAFTTPTDRSFGVSRFGVLAMSRSVDAPPTVATASISGPVGRVLGSAPWYPGLIDVAVRDTATGSMARARLVIDPAGAEVQGPALSDILVIQAEAFPRDLDAALAVATPTLTFDEGSSVGIYWEMYRIPAGVADLSLVVVRNDKAELGRLGAPVPAPKGDTPIRIGWKDAPETRASVEPQSLGVDLSRLRPGRYLVVIEARMADGKVVRTARPIQIVRTER